MPLVSCLAAVLAAAPLEAPVTHVTVFADRARITRTAKLTLAGEQTVTFPALPSAAEEASIRVEADGADVARVELERVAAGELPLDDAKALVAQAQQVTVELARVRRDLAATQRQVRGLADLAPSAPGDVAGRPAPKLTPAQWPQSTAALGDLLAAAQASQRALEKEERGLVEKERTLRANAQKLGALTRGPFSVQPQATLRGSGAATVTLTYVVQQAQWLPAWDLQFLPATNTVQLGLAGLVTQRSGEDWTQAALVLSTAFPLLAAQAPKLLAWKIGTTDRFVPTPSPRLDLVRPLPAQRPTPQGPTEEQLWRRLLAAPVAKGALAPPPAEPQPVGPAEQEVMDEEVDARSDAYAGAPPPAPAPPPPPPRPQPARAPADDMPMSMATTESLDRAPGSRGPAKRYVPTQDVGFGPPPSWSPPPVSPNSAIGLAGGYELSFASLQRETVASGSGTRRVALWAAQWPVKVERQLFPAVSPNAYLTAQLKNPSSQVLPGGAATLSVGSDPAGAAQLGVMAPGEAVTLPLGIDRALRPVRNVAVVSTVEGLLTKEDVSTYTVTIELVNPHPAPVDVRVKDQWPLSTQKEVVTTLVSSKPLATQDQKAGHLEWLATLKPQEKAVFSFTYTLRRPKGWRLGQTEVRR